jgi:hypothetical protein
MEWQTWEDFNKSLEKQSWDSFAAPKLLKCGYLFRQNYLKPNLFEKVWVCLREQMLYFFSDRTEKVLLSAFPLQEARLLDFPTKPPPEWSENQECFGCQKSFSFFVRRHHCRRCGQSFCNICANASVPLPLQGFNTPTRVCRECHNVAIVTLGMLKIRYVSLAMMRSESSEDISLGSPPDSQLSGLETAPNVIKDSLKRLAKINASRSDEKNATKLKDVKENVTGGPIPDSEFNYSRDLFSLPGTALKYLFALKSPMAEVWFAAESCVQKLLWVARLQASFSLGAEIGVVDPRLGICPGSWAADEAVVWAHELIAARKAAPGLPLKQTSTDKKYTVDTPAPDPAAVLRALHEEDLVAGFPDSEDRAFLLARLRRLVAWLDPSAAEEPAENAPLAASQSPSLLARRAGAHTGQPRPDTTTSVLPAAQGSLLKANGVTFAKASEEENADSPTDGQADERTDVYEELNESVREGATDINKIKQKGIGKPKRKKGKVIANMHLIEAK